MSESVSRKLNANEIEQLEAQGCTCDDWWRIEVAPGFRTERVQRTHFSGQVRIGSLDGEGRAGSGPVKPSGIYDATLHDCHVGDHVRISHVGVHLAHLQIGDHACIEHVGLLETRPGALFGNGVEVAVLNEGGGREVRLFDGLDAQIAYLLCVHRYRTTLVEKLQTWIQDRVEQARSDSGVIGAGAVIRSVRRMVDCRVGPGAVIDGAGLLENGTILSAPDAVTRVGADVQARDFIIGESSVVDGGAVISSSFVGQGCRVGRQFSAENCLFFANCEAFHGEGCSLFAGPYTVTHHKSTLLIAGLFSFYNAGSGSNQSNHLYKLGPVHEGKLERGSKTGSFSYMMWPCRVGPFSVVLGKHTRPFDTSDFPFSHIEAAPDGRPMMIPGFNLSTVGTVRDGAKWPKRDRRTGAVRRDRISFDVFSPYTVGRMMRGSARLQALQESTPREVDSVSVGGADVKRVLLRSGQKFFRPGIQMYLLDRILARAEGALRAGSDPVEAVRSAAPDGVFSEAWVDLGGQLLPADRIERLDREVADGTITGLDDLQGALDAAMLAADADAWNWVRWAALQELGLNLDEADASLLAKVADDLVATRTKFLSLVLIDAGKEFDGPVRIGFGVDGDATAQERDFEAVRGTRERNGFVRDMESEIAGLAGRAASLKAALGLGEAS